MKDKNLIAASLLLIVGVILGYLIAASKPHDASVKPQGESETKQTLLLNLNGASQILGLSPDEIKGVIQAEKSFLDAYGSYIGMMLPYVIINGKYYFEREKLMQWARSITAEKKEYKNGTLSP